MRLDDPEQTFAAGLGEAVTAVAIRQGVGRDRIGRGRRLQRLDVGGGLVVAEHPQRARHNGVPVDELARDRREFRDGVDADHEKDRGHRESIPLTIGAVPEAQREERQGES